MAAAAAEEGQVISVNTVDEWKAHLESANQTKKLVVVDFTAVWCGPCRFIGPILDGIAKKMPQVIFFKVDVDKLKTVAEDWAVESMPTFIFLKEGSIIDRIVGAHKDALLATINKHAATGVDTASA